MNTLPPAANTRPFQQECEDYSYLDPEILSEGDVVGRETHDWAIGALNEMTLQDAKNDPQLFAGQKGIHLIADETEQALSGNPNKSEVQRDREAVQTLEEAAFTGVVSEGLMTIRGCHNCIKEACALRDSATKNIEGGDKAMDSLLNLRNKVMHRRFIRNWAENFSQYDRASKRVVGNGHDEQSTRNLMFMGSLRDSFRDMLMQHVQPDGRDKVMRDIYQTVPEASRSDFASFSNSIAGEIFVYEELHQVVRRFTEAGREGCSVRFSTQDEDVKYGTDIVLTLTDKEGRTTEYAIDAKSRGSFKGTSKKDFGDSKYFGMKEVKDQSVIVVNPEGPNDEASYISIEKVGKDHLASYSKRAGKGSFGPKIVTTLLKAS